MKRTLFSIICITLTFFAFVRCTDDEIEAFKPVDVSPYDAIAKYFNYNGITHFVVTFNNGSTPVVLDLCTTALSTTQEKVVQPGSYAYNATAGNLVLGSMSKLNGQAISTGTVSVEKNFLTYTIAGNLNGTSISYTGYIFTVTNVNATMKVTGCLEGPEALKLANAEGDTLYVPYSNSFVGTLTLGPTSYFKTANGTRYDVIQGTLTITKDDVYNVSGSLFTSAPAGITVTGKWSNAPVISGTITYTVTDQAQYNNAWCVIQINDKSGNIYDIVVIANLGSTFYSAAGSTFSVANTFANNTIVAGYDWGAWGSGGTSITTNGTKKLVTGGSLTFTSNDGNSIAVEGTLTDGSNNYAVSGSYIKPVSMHLLGVSDWTAYGGTYTLKFGGGNTSASFNWGTFSYDYSGTGEYLSVEFKQAIAAGTYTAKANDASDFNAASNFIIGYFNTTYSSYSGTMLGNLVSGALTQEIVKEGTISVAENAGTYSMTFYLTTESGKVFASSFAGALSK